MSSLESTTVVVGSSSELGFDIIGSGVILSHQKNQKLLVLTASHVIRVFQDEPISIRVGADIFLMKILALDTDNDLGLLISEVPTASSGPKTTIYPDILFKGQEVLTIGSRFGSETPWVRQSIIEQTKDERRNVFSTDLRIFGGDSGAGVFDLNTGKLLGIIITYSVRAIPLPSLDKTGKPVWGTAFTITSGDAVHRDIILKLIKSISTCTYEVRSSCMRVLSE